MPTRILAWASKYRINGNIRFDEIAGMIVEDGESPLIFKDHDEMVDAWIDLHLSFGVPFTGEECDYLDIDPDEDQDEDDDEEDED